MSARYAIPSSEEVKQLNETAGLQAATLLRLQCDELVQEVRCQPGKSGKALEEWIPALADALSGLPPCVLRGESIATGFRFDGCGVQQAISALMGAALEFEPPAAVNVVGSHAAGTMLKASGTQRVVDVAVSMPSSCLAPRDFVSYRYLAKRALYLGHLAAVLSSRSDLAKRCEVSSFRGDPCKPCIIISPNLNLNRQHHYLVRLLVSVPEGALDPSKLAPWRSNVRRLVQQESDASPPPTPRYNSSVLEDMGLISHSRAIRDALSGSESARACALLGKVWLAQRGFLASSDSICGFSWSMILVHLLETHAVSPRLTPLAMFQAVINFLACSAAVEGAGLEIPLGSPSWSDATQQLKAHSAAFPAVLLDAELGVNVLWRVSSSGWREVREAAQYSLKLLQHSPADAFSHLFMRFVGPLRRYDAFLSLSYSAWEPASCPGAGSHLGDALCDTTMDRAMADRVTAILSRALSDRVKAIRPMLPQDCRYKGVSQPDIVIVDGTKWAITDDPPPAPLLIVGLCLNPSSAGRIVDRGPSADDSAAAADFRGFWGDRSELRRFQDGAIVEAVVWDGSSPHHIVERISRCALCRHCPPLAEGQVGFCGDGTALESIWVGNDVVMTQGAISVFDEFIKKLKGLPGLPLRLNTALPASACLRYTSLLPPFGHPLAGSTQKGMTITTSQIDPIDTVLRFEASSLWPRDLKAVAAVRQAFLLRIREQLEKENDGKYTVSGDLACGGDALEVFSGGFCFRVWISCDVEELAMREAKSPELKQLLRQRYGTDHHTAIHVLATQQPPYGPSVRLALRWLASRSLSNHFTLEAIELMVAHAWTEALAGRGVRAPPGSALGGFLRFLLLLGSFPWDDEPLIVDLGGSMTLTDRQGAADAFAAAQHTKSHRSSLFIATSYDGRERLDQPWTGDGPEHSVLLVARAAAMASAEGLLAYLRSGGDSHAWKNVLRPSPPRFDICLSIAQGLCFGRKPAMSGSKALEIRARGCAAMRIPAFKNLSVQTKHLLVDFDPVRSLVREMERLYGHLMIVFWNATTKSNIGIVWRPQAFLASPFKPLQSRYAIYIGDGQVVPNAPELLLELKSIGGDMVDALTF